MSQDSKAEGCAGLRRLSETREKKVSLTRAYMRGLALPCLETASYLLKSSIPVQLLVRDLRSAAWQCDDLHLTIGHWLPRLTLLLLLHPLC